MTAGLSIRDIFHGLGLYMDILCQGLDEQDQDGSSRWTYPTVILTPNGCVSDRTQRYTEVVVRPITNRLAHVERREQRVAIYWGEISPTLSLRDPTLRTSAHQEIESDIYEGVGRDGGLHRF